MALCSSDNEKIFEAVGRCAFIRIDLDRITSNLMRLQAKLQNGTGIIGVVKANAYGHGSVGIAKHIKGLGVEKLAVATVGEGVELREAGLQGPILVFGNAHPNEARVMFHNQLTPTVSSVHFADVWAKMIHNQKQVSGWQGAVEIEVNTGLNRNGVEVDDVDDFVNGIYQHFSRGVGSENEEWNKQQLAVFLKVATKYRALGIKLHAASSIAAMNGIGTCLDFVRVGKVLYGLDVGYWSQEEKASLKSSPFAMSVIATPTRVKLVPEGSYVGYGEAYRADSPEIIGTLPVGFADGFGRFTMRGGFVRGMDGKYYSIVGGSCMDATMVKLDSLEQENKSFFVMSDDFDPKTCEAARRLDCGNTPLDYNTSRLPRVYISNGIVQFIIGGL